MAYIIIKDQKYLSQIALTGVSESSLEFIHLHKELLIPLTEDIVEELYDEIYKTDQLNKIIDRHSSLERLKIAQKRYLTQIFTPIIDDSYIENRFLIGRVHSRIGLELPWYISTNHRYCQIISKHLASLLPFEKAFHLIEAIEALFNFDMQIIVAAYNEIEVDKAHYPLRYEFLHLVKKSGLTEEDFNVLDSFSGFLRFRITEIMDRYEKELFKRLPGLLNKSGWIHQFTAGFRHFFKQFFQERIYRDEAACYRIIRDLTRKLIDHKITDHTLTALVDTMNEVLRDIFLSKNEIVESDIPVFLNSFERYTRFFLAILKEFLQPYRFLHTYSFLNLYSYEISRTDFGKLTWLDENAGKLLSSRGINAKEKLGGRCYEVFYNRALPCLGCPALSNSSEPALITFNEGPESSYYKTWRYHQSSLAELNHSLIVSQDITEDAKVIFTTIESLLDLAEFRDDETGQHVDRIGFLSGKLAELLGCDEKFIQDIKIAAKFHDIGKVGIPDSILNKPGKLSPEEWESMKTHVQIGHQILAKLELPVIQMAARIAKTHHEHWDGNGYPNHLKGEEIPLEGRIVSIVDVFDALLSKRAYKDPFPPEKVKGIILENRGSHFDPKIADLFLSMWEDFLEIYKDSHTVLYV